MQFWTIPMQPVTGYHGSALFPPQEAVESNAYFIILLEASHPDYT